MSTRAITHWLLMEHKTEVDLPFTAGFTTTSSAVFLASTQRPSHTNIHTNKKVLGNGTFSMNYKFTFFFKSITKRPYFTTGKKKKIISVEMDGGLLCWRENSSNRNGNVPPSIWSGSVWDVFSRWQFELEDFPIFFLSVFVAASNNTVGCWGGLFRAWQKSNSMNLMPLFDLPDPTNMLMHAHKQLSHRRAHFLSNPCHGAVGAGVSPSIYWAEVREIPRTSCEDMRGLTDKQTHSYCMNEPFHFFLLLLIQSNYPAIVLSGEIQEVHASSTENP